MCHNVSYITIYGRTAVPNTQLGWRRDSRSLCGSLSVKNRRTPSLRCHPTLRFDYGNLNRRHNRYRAWFGIASIRKNQILKGAWPPNFPSYSWTTRWLDPWAARQFVQRKFSNQQLIGALQSVYQDQCLGASKKRLVIPAFNQQERSHKLFKTAHHQQFTIDYKLPAWKVAMATAAAPTFFKAYQIDGREFIDGGVWANDPIMVGVTEAVTVLEQPLSRVRVLSIGTLRPVRSSAWSLRWGGKLHWAPAVANLMIEAQSVAAQAQAQHFIGKPSLIRVNPEANPKEIVLDDARCIPALIAKANHSRSTFLLQFLPSLVTKPLTSLPATRSPDESISDK